MYRFSLRDCCALGRRSHRRHDTSGECASAPSAYQRGHRRRDRYGAGIGICAFVQGSLDARGARGGRSGADFRRGRYGRTRPRHSRGRRPEYSVQHADARHRPRLRRPPNHEERPGLHQLTVRYPGDDAHQGSSDTTAFVVDKDDPDLDLAVDGKGSNRTMTARLSDRDTPSDGIAGRTVAFFADGEPIGSATTDADGVATLKQPPRYRGANHDFEVRFDGDDYYVSSSDWERQ